MISIDFHCHSNTSPDSLADIKKLVTTARARGLTRLVITDHNSIVGALEAKALDPDLIVVGEEIKTTRGEILAAFVKELIPRGLSPLETIGRLREQGAFISISHPFDLRSGAWVLADLLDITHFVDAIEVFNSRCIKKDANHLALNYARQYNLPGIAGSDAHSAFELGNARLMLPPFKGPDGLRNVIREGKVLGRRAPFWVHLLSRYAQFRKWAENSFVRFI
jgi:predicted metal-dependent phosphoesterase TrpH